MIKKFIIECLIALILILALSLLLSLLPKPIVNKVNADEDKSYNDNPFDSTFEVIATNAPDIYRTKMVGDFLNMQEYFLGDDPETMETVAKLYYCIK